MASSKFTAAHNTILTNADKSASLPSLVAAVNKTASIPVTAVEVERQLRSLGLIKGNRSTAN